MADRDYLFGISFFKILNAIMLIMYSCLSMDTLLAGKPEI